MQLLSSCLVNETFSKRTKKDQKDIYSLNEHECKIGLYLESIVYTQRPNQTWCVVIWWQNHRYFRTTSCKEGILSLFHCSFCTAPPSCKDRPIHPPTVYIYNNLRHTNDYFDDTLSLSLLRVLLCAVYITNQFTHLRLTTVYNTYLYGFALLGMGEEKDWLHDWLLGVVGTITVTSSECNKWLYRRGTLGSKPKGVTCKVAQKGGIGFDFSTQNTNILGILSKQGKPAFPAEPAS